MTGMLRIAVTNQSRENRTDNAPPLSRMLCSWRSRIPAMSSRVAAAILGLESVMPNLFAVEIIGDPLFDGPMLRPPAERGRGFATHAAVGAERIDRRGAAPKGDRVRSQPGLRRAEFKPCGDGFDDLAQT